MVYSNIDSRISGRAFLFTPKRNLQQEKKDSTQKGNTRQTSGKNAKSKNNSQKDN
jgi:hypothetical protein